MTQGMIVTGGSRGIGRAVALLAADRGWDVAISWRSDSAAAAEVMDQIRAKGRRATGIQGDVADEAHVAALFDAAQTEFGGIDSVVVNAGMLAQGMPLAQMTLERMQRVIDVNVIGALLTAREAARRMSRGSIVLLSSAAAKLGGPGEYVDYAASKGAIDSLNTGLAKELARQNVRVNAVRPGLIDTEIHASGGDPGRAARLASSVPMGRTGSADEVAEAVLWLASDQASYVTGTILEVTGGR
ncbi:SDR family oxidoreductase [Paracoccus laeviglucosivorans]|uniref:NAD(P)-dependent dehydrogenase, short-chain alcohol dehydrogenase family n=1 Tax=Paracoccus laeviglucosivorans TaxID=1197861 RepID=A0A521DGU4_9RHOB|nr:SDR family oxidoreductase [Paracoccus laeviglucosivorans]SMO70802.1 NAD(P)-dependent dehydrogenase, short-chain alcohol dehydrogenase family [Paracoccus laeviglucosivorans]